MSTHTFSTDDNPALFLEQDDGSGKPARLAAGSQVLVRNADDGTPLDSTTALDLGYLSFTTTDVQGVQVSGDNGATWKGPFWSKEAREAAVKRQVDLLSSSGVLIAGITNPVIDAHLGGDATGLVTDVAGITPGNGKRAVGKNELIYNVLDYGAKGDGVTDDTAAIQSLHDTVSAGATQGATILIPRTDAFFRVDGTIRIGRRMEIQIQQGAIVRRTTDTTSTEPVFRLGANEARLTGRGRVESQNASPWGIVLVGPRDITVLTNVLSGEVSGIVIQGVSATGNIGLRMSSSLIANMGATYQNNINGITLTTLGTGIYVADVANANDFHGVQMRSIKDVCYDFYGNTSKRGADECGIFGGFLHASPGAIGIRLRNTVFDQFYGIRMEMGTGAVAYDIDETSQMNHLFIIDNQSGGGSSDRGVGNTILSNGLLAGPVRAVKKTADSSVTNSTAYVDVPGMSIPLLPNATYEWSAFVIYDATTTADAKFKITVPSGATADWTCRALATNGTSDMGPGTYGYETEATANVAGGAGIGTKLVARLSGTITTSATAGNLGIQYGQLTAEATALTVYARSSIRTTRIS